MSDDYTCGIWHLADHDGIPISQRNQHAYDCTYYQIVECNCGWLAERRVPAKLANAYLLLSTWTRLDVALPQPDGDSRPLTDEERPT